MLNELDMGESVLVKIADEQHRPRLAAARGALEWLVIASEASR